jgi:hypothetical protein
MVLGELEKTFVSALIVYSMNALEFFDLKVLAVLRYKSLAKLILAVQTPSN